MLNFYNSHELANLYNVPSAYREAVSDVLGAILATLETPAYTVTVDVSDFLPACAQELKAELQQIGYSIDDSTTPGSWIILWS
jgi:hypothetical protein